MKRFCSAAESGANHVVYIGVQSALVDRIGVRDLRMQAAAAIRRAQAGERIVITVAGRAAAQLGPLDPAGKRPTLDDLIVRGLVVAPRRRDRPVAGRAISVWAGARLDRLLREQRG
jgi:antitoxin (DNA-binding transcriptional repressor) of toxin-antitoxin stability system